MKFISGEQERGIKLKPASEDERMISSSAILVCDRDNLFRETLQNFLLAAGYTRVEVVATMREARAKLRRENYGCVVIGMTAPPFSRRQQLATITQLRQPQARVVILVQAAEQHLIQDHRFDYAVKEYAFSTLLELLKA